MKPLPTKRKTRKRDGEGAQVGEIDPDPQMQLLSVIVHDLKDPLAAIVMGGAFLQRTLPEGDAAARRVADAIYRSATRLGGTIQDLNVMTRLQAGTLALEPKRRDAAPMLAAAVEACAPAAKEKGIVVEHGEGPAGLQVMADEEQLQRILVKLLDNAIKFTAAGKRVSASVARVGSEVRFTVEDEGRGIAPDRIESIFDVLANARQRPRDGSGLGLGIARGLARLHGGKVRVKSEVGRGSTFVLIVPALVAD
jgi:signal transduction histidine kinase